MISKLSLRWSRLPSEIARLPYGEKVFMFASLMSENEELRDEIASMRKTSPGPSKPPTKSVRAKRSR